MLAVVNKIAVRKWPTSSLKPTLEVITIVTKKEETRRRRGG